MKNSRVVQFVIDGKELYLEKVLVETSVPLFFICKDDSDIRYSVLCTDTFEFKYVLIQSYNEDIQKMLKKRISMRELFNRAVNDIYWQVEVSEDGSDIVTVGSIIDIPREYLPGAVPYISTDEKYEKTINRSVFHNKLLIKAYQLYLLILLVYNIIFSQKHINTVISSINILIGFYLIILINKEIKRGGKR